MNLLSVHKKMTCEQLATALQVDPRTVRHYITDLYDAGIQIETIAGRYGGYLLNDHPVRILSTMNSEEYAACIQADKFLKQKQFVNYEAFQNAIRKITLANEAKELKAYSLQSLGQHISNEEACATDKAYYHQIEEAIRLKQKLSMVYQSLSSGENKRTVHPYSTFEFQSSLYILGYCEKRCQVLYFKCSRIIKLVVLEELYEDVQDYDLEKILNKSLGLFYGDVYHVKMIIKYPMSYIIKEKQIAQGQKIRELEDKSIHFEAALSGLEDIKRWVLSFGTDAEVIEPVDLREVIAKEIENMAKKYIE
ncbi:WYL domain-containing transcriptional regulator [Vallitalea pronyensis]|uniref:WYL domain-containing transcriptional regulator n=1 Tax=Vallitalea pronyensis TaxID=1348613 RepID=A0A8J8SHW3_9FIRM|nr:WYL domain-containing transcriptional regulator [Vallitalea pronyensis]QUI23981.1 WYL domain-containing transcriptional regulator [Vallitalea pronyensis]